MASSLLDYFGMPEDDEQMDYSSSLLGRPKRKYSGPDMGMLGLAAGLLEPTANGQLGPAFANGLKGWAGGVAAQRKLDEADAENDPQALMQKYMAQAAAKAQAAKQFGVPSKPVIHSIGNRLIAINPDTLEEAKSWDISPTPTAQLTKGMQYGPDGSVQAIPGWRETVGGNEYAQKAPIENLKTGNNIFEHQQNNAADVGKEKLLTPLRGDQEYSKKTGEDAAKRYNTILEEGMNAQGDVSNYNRLDNILADYEGGKLSGFRQNLGEFANSLGIKNVDPNLDEKQLFHSIVGEAALKRLKQMGGNDSNQDREFVLKMGPAMEQTAEGRKQIINFYKGISNQRVLRSQMAQKWVQSYGRIDASNPNGQTFDQRWNEWVNKNPVSESLQ